AGPVHGIVVGKRRRRESCLGQQLMIIGHPEASRSKEILFKDLSIVDRGDECDWPCYGHGLASKETVPTIALNKSAFDCNSERSEEPAFSQKSKNTTDSAPRNDNREGFFNKCQERSQLHARVNPRTAEWNCSSDGLPTSCVFCTSVIRFSLIEGILSPYHN